MKTAIVTGGGSGIGLAIARALAAESFRVGVVGRREEALRAAVESIAAEGGQAWWGLVDVRDEAAVRAFVDSTVQRCQQIDLLVNNAGVFRIVPMEEMTAEVWDETLDTNLRGVFLFCKAVWPHIEGGQIINIGSVAGIQGYAGSTAYCASKFGLNGFSEALALEGRQRGIRVHVVSPGNTDTPIWGGVAPSEVPERMMSAETVAETVRWLAVGSPEATFDQIVIRPRLRPKGVR